jgi:nucleoside-diphosphate-sugar epimerase
LNYIGGILPVRRILITGAAGFVGRHFTRRFLEIGDEVHAVDSLVPLTGRIDPASGWPLFEPRDFNNFRFHRQDCRDYFKHNPNKEFDYAVHLAAVVGGRLMIEQNPLAVAEDLAIDAAYWQWAKTANPGKTLTFSSSAAYPVKYQCREKYVLLKEDMICFENELGLPDMSYGWAKLTTEYLGKLAFERHGLKSVCYRPFSGYGEDQDEAYPFPSICKRVLENAGAPVITVWGSGIQMRDFIHIDDCVNAVLQTMDRIDDGGAVNLSTGVLTSFIEFANIAARLCGFSPEIRGSSDMPTGVFARGGDITKQLSLGVRHAITFPAGIERALTHYSLPTRVGALSSPFNLAD